MYLRWGSVIAFVLFSIPDLIRRPWRVQFPSSMICLCSLLICLYHHLCTEWSWNRLQRKLVGRVNVVQVLLQFNRVNLQLAVTLTTATIHRLNVALIPGSSSSLSLMSSWRRSGGTNHCMVFFPNDYNGPSPSFEHFVVINLAPSFNSIFVLAHKTEAALDWWWSWLVLSNNMIFFFNF